MRLLLTAAVLKRLRRELRRAGSREIGGLLMGEHVDADLFRIVEISVQRSGGTAAHFVRNPVEHAAALRAFFARTGADYTRFNYLGEWHSHPTFVPVPSSIDLMTMQALVEDPAVGVNFLVLLIVTLGASRTIEATATVFTPHSPSTTATFLSERLESTFDVVRRLFRLVRNRRGREQR